MLPSPTQPPANDDTARVLIRRLVMEYAREHWRRYVFAFVLMALAAACTAGSAYLIGDVVNEAYVNKNLTGIFVLGFITVALFTAKGLATYGQAVTLSRIGNSIVAENQRRIFRKLLDQNLGFFADRHSSEFIARLTAGSTAATQVLNLLITAIGRDGLSLVGLVIVMVVQDPWMSLVGLVVAPPALIVLRKLVRRVRGIALDQFTGGAHILETMQETLQGIRIVKAFGLEDTMRARFDSNIAYVETQANKMARVANRASPLMESLGGIAIALAFVYGGYRVIATDASPGQFFSFITAFLLAYEPAKRLARLNIDLNSGLVGVRILFDIVDMPATETSDAGAKPLAMSAGRLEARNVTFGYRKDEPVLHGVSFVAEPGKTTALVGPSGGGKSTVLNLILRLHEPSQGAILIDDQDISAVTRASLRQQIAYVGQDVFLFRGTIRDNIAFGRIGASEDEIVAAARAAYAHDFITNFPLGYDTPVGEHGAQLSGGQRQRISVARALVRDAKIILLDEPTAALDAESEREVQRAFDRLCENRTTIVIAHRLHTVAHADTIHVIENGAIVESGRHADLLAANRRYASFYRLQLQHQQPADAAAG